MAQTPHPGPDDRPGSILSAWTALEALSPQTFGSPRDLADGDLSRLADLTLAPLPWIEGPPPPKDHRLYYRITLGAVPMGPATDALIRAFGRDEEASTHQRSRAAIAEVLVNQEGHLVDPNGIAISSFPWALPKALQQDLNRLGEWPYAEQGLLTEMAKRLSPTDGHTEPRPLDLQTLTAAYEWLVEACGLPADLVEPVAWAVRIQQHEKARTPPEASLLNSFFLKDLASARRRLTGRDAPAGLRRYLGLDGPERTVDLLADRQALEEAVAPGLTPAARWPSPGGHPLVLLQQAAVNLARSELATNGGLVAVNGPPGTGKTTLLRDLVAACVLDRAEAMVAFDDPARAFEDSDQKVHTGGQAYFRIHTLDPTLKGHEVLVASSNNKAVENISGELPGIGAIGRPPAEAAYFKTVSDRLHGSDSTGPEGAPETWGLIAAVLGNARNRSAFLRTFWWDPDAGFSLYLKAIYRTKKYAGKKEGAENRGFQPATPAILAAEQPPTSRTAALAAWQTARQRLVALKQQITEDLAALEEVRRLHRHLSDSRRQRDEDARLLAECRSRTAEAATRTVNRRLEADAARRHHADACGRVDLHLAEKPALMGRLLRSPAWGLWEAAHRLLTDEQTRARTALAAAEKGLSDAAAAEIALAARLAEIETRLAALNETLEYGEAYLTTCRDTTGDRTIDATVLLSDHEEINLTAPWLPDSLHRKREDLFLAAMAVHRAFIGAAAQPLYHNLGALMDMFQNGMPRDREKRRLLGDLWASLFMVIPVVSTTFASVERMLGPLPPDSLGWLLVDEAGQALPQAAVGAILRARRSILVGDPLQIPPVVTLPRRLTKAVCDHFGVDGMVWSAPDASAQTLADQVSRYQAEFAADPDVRRVGLPLLVHRRCREPMFGISNRIAYAGQMVHAPTLRPGVTAAPPAPLGPSCWFDSEGEADSKWSPAEGDMVARLLRRLVDAGERDPDVFLISPFRIVAQELRRRLERERDLFAAIGVNGGDWVKDRIGTIHTFQGREAGTVFLVLGAPAANQTGARQWATGSPHILNVAVSRAKNTLYVVGSHAAWSGLGYARELAILPVHQMHAV